MFIYKIIIKNHKDAIYRLSGGLSGRKPNVIRRGTVVQIIDERLIDVAIQAYLNRFSSNKLRQAIRYKYNLPNIYASFYEVPENSILKYRKIVDMPDENAPKTEWLKYEDTLTETMKDILRTCLAGKGTVVKSTNKSASVAYLTSLGGRISFLFPNSTIFDETKFLIHSAR
jgi:hypothetical protein